MKDISVLLYCCSDVAHKLAVIISEQTTEIVAAASSKMLVPHLPDHMVSHPSVCLIIFVNMFLMYVKFYRG